MEHLIREVLRLRPDPQVLRVNAKPVSAQVPNNRSTRGKLTGDTPGDELVGPLLMTAPRYFLGDSAVYEATRVLPGCRFDY